MVTQDDPRFPASLKLIPYPPPLLFIKGTLTPADSLAVAMVGTRGASYYGLKAARRQAGAISFYSRDIYYYTWTSQPGYLVVLPDDYRFLIRRGYDIAQSPLFFY
jgi:DNA recombination-mediator protein A